MGAKIFKFDTKTILCEFSGQYVAVNQVMPTSEVTKVVCTGADLIPGAAMFFFNDVEFRQYYVWYNRDDMHKDPCPGGKQGYEVKINSSDTATQIAQKTSIVIDAIIGFTSSYSGDTVTITCDEAGDVYPAEDYNTGFYIYVNTKGCYTVSLYNGRLWKDCQEIKDVILKEDGSAEIFYTMAKTYTSKMNKNKRFDVHQEFFMDDFRVIPADWITYL